jgi:orotate phosphoribosyltransferase
MTAEEIGSATARLLLEAGAIQVSGGRPYVLAAGWASPVYVDCRRLIGEPRFRHEAVSPRRQSLPR